MALTLDDVKRTAHLARIEIGADEASQVLGYPEGYPSPHLSPYFPLGLHLVLRRASFVEYRFARIEMASDLSAGIASGRFELLDSVSEQLLGHVRNGILKSAFIRKKCQTYFDKNK